MKLAYLTEVAALLSSHSHLLIERPEPLSNSVLGDFYIHSRNRFNRWLRDLNDIEQGVAIRDPLHLIGMSPLRAPVQSLTEQILVNDLLNRVWTVAAIACDRQRNEDRAETLVKNVLRGHLIVRHKALGLCLNNSGLTAEQVIHVNKLRKSAERWSDMLNCMLMGQYDLWDYAYDLDRAKEFYEERIGTDQHKSGSAAWKLILAGLRHSFADVDGLAAPLHDDDRLIARVMMDAFPPGAGNIEIWNGSAMVKQAQ